MGIILNMKVKKLKSNSREEKKHDKGPNNTE
jgi:hypothetical protein